MAKGVRKNDARQRKLYKQRNKDCSVQGESQGKWLECSIHTAKQAAEGETVITATTMTAAHITEQAGPELCTKNLTCVISLHPVRYYYDGHFIDEETEAQESQETCSR